MNTLSVKECLSFGWKTYWARPWLFVLAGVVVFLVNILFSIPQSVLDFVAESMKGTPGVAMLSLFILIVTLIGFIVSVYVQIGTTRFFLKAHDDVAAAQIRDLIHLKGFWRYVGASILVTLAVVAGLILLIIPGIIVALALTFALYLVVDKELGPLESFKQSFVLTKGHRWSLLLLSFAVVGINILGFLALVVGLFVTVPVSMLVMAHAYRVLSAPAPGTVVGDVLVEATASEVA
jgi:uncharacterized membrane protein